MLQFANRASKQKIYLTKKTGKGHRHVNLDNIFSNTKKVAEYASLSPKHGNQRQRLIPCLFASCNPVLL